LKDLPIKLDFEGAHNFRDMGGYPLQEQRRVRQRRLFRSDHLGRLTDPDQVLLEELGIRTVIDLRRAEEREEARDRIAIAGVEEIWLPVTAEGADVVTLRHRLERGEMGPGEAYEFLVEANQQFVDTFKGVFSQFLHLLLEEHRYPIVFHCSAGKDRAGYAAAMTLFALGASPETVMHDYLATNHITANYVEGLVDGVHDHPGIDVNGDALRTLMQVQPAFLGAALDQISQRHGGVAAYLDHQLDFGRDKRERLAGLLAE